MRKFFLNFCRCAPALLLFIWISTPIVALAADKKPGRKGSGRLWEPGAELFTDPRARTFKIQIEEPHLSALKKDNRQYVRASFNDGTTVYKDVGVHLKGMGSFRPLEDKPSLAVKFDHYLPEQSYEGLTKLMLNNASQDATFFAEYLATSLFTDAGVPAARVTHARVELNGRDLGPYVVIEAMNKTFLKRFFNNPDGNLYEAYTQDINQQLDRDSGLSPDQSDLKALFAAASDPNPAQRYHRLDALMDIDRFLSFIALEMFTCQSDGYALNRNNYRLYHDPTSGRMVFITHGLDWAFANWGQSVRPPMDAILVKALLSNPQVEDRYRERVGELFTNFFQLKIMTNRLAEGLSRMKTAARHTNEVKQFEQFAAAMRDRLVARHKNISDQLGIPAIPTLKFDQNSMAKVTGWEGRVASGNATITVATEDKIPLLQIQSQGSSSIASFRTRVRLLPGHYIFVGKVRTKGVAVTPGDPGSGAGLRVSGGQRQNYLSGSVPWKKMEYTLDVPDNGGEVELVCELRANQGEAWFDTDSLHLLKKKN